GRRGGRQGRPGRVVPARRRRRGRRRADPGGGSGHGDGPPPRARDPPAALNPVTFPEELTGRHHWIRARSCAALAALSQEMPSPSTAAAFGSSASALPGTSSLPRRRPLPTSTYGRSATAASTSTGQPSGRPRGVMPPYSMPVSPVAVSIGAKDALRAPSRRRTTPLTSARVVDSTRQAASVVSPPRLPATTTQFADRSSRSRP